MVIYQVKGISAKAGRRSSLRLPLRPRLRRLASHGAPLRGSEAAASLLALRAYCRARAGLALRAPLRPRLVWLGATPWCPRRSAPLRVGQSPQFAPLRLRGAPAGAPFVPLSVLGSVAAKPFHLRGSLRRVAPRSRASRFARPQLGFCSPPLRPCSADPLTPAPPKGEERSVPVCHWYLRSRKRFCIPF